jgi:hypothetical protein
VTLAHWDDVDARRPPQPAVGGAWSDLGTAVPAYGQRNRIGGAYLPKAAIYWLYPSWTEAGQGEHPFDREQHLEWPAPGERPSSIVSLDDVEGAFGGIAKRLGAVAGAEQSGLNWVALPPNEEGSPPHCHSAEEEVFVVLDGEHPRALGAAEAGRAAGHGTPGNAPAPQGPRRLPRRTTRARTRSSGAASA